MATRLRAPALRLARGWRGWTASSRGLGQDARPYFRQAPSNPDPALAGAAVRALLLQVQAELRLPARAPEAPWLGLSEWLHQRLPAEVSRDEAAAAIGVHPNHVSRLVRRHAGIGFARWVAERRIELACALLAGTGLTAAEAGRRCGIGNAAHFSRVFHAHRGLSPGAWRRASSSDPASQGCGRSDL